MGFFHMKGIDSQTSSYVMYKVRTCGNKYFAICALTQAKRFVSVTRFKHANVTLGLMETKVNNPYNY